MAQIPYPHSSSGPSQFSPAPEDARTNEFRNATNFRSVTRNDPSTQEILETSVYSVIYHYDETVGWEKQKQEGPLFVVRRDKAPEYALFMLNRQTVKNVLIPLVPGEMKLTVVDASTLQVARRGEKQRRGVWFSEGPGAIEKFKETILRICGEPSKRPISVLGQGGSSHASPATPAPLPANPVSSTAGGDGLSRLFANLGTAPSLLPHSASTSNLARPQAAASSPSPLPRTTQSNPPAPTFAHTPPPLQQPVPTHLAQPPPTASEPAPTLVSPPFSGPPGQTVDDLLMSILGGSPPPLPPQPTIPQVSAPPQQPIPTPTNSIPPNQSNNAPEQLETLLQSPPPNAKRSSRVGDATFAQAAAAKSPEAPPIQPTRLEVTPAQQPQNQSFSPIPIPLPQQMPSASNAPPQFRQGGPPHLDRAANGVSRRDQQRPIPPPNPIRDAVLDGLDSAFHHGKIMPAGSTDEVGKRRFVQDLLQLIHTEPRFVDDVWHGFLMRTGQAAPG